MANKDRCGRIKCSDATVVWDDETDLKGNRQKRRSPWPRNNNDPNGVPSSNPWLIGTTETMRFRNGTGRPSLRELYEDGQIDLTAYQEAKRLRDEGPRNRPFQPLISALRRARAAAVESY